LPKQRPIKLIFADDKFKKFPKQRPILNLIEADDKSRKLPRQDQY